jgi:hypothetical protein
MWKGEDVMPAIFNAQVTELGEVYQLNNIIFVEAKYILPTAKYIDIPTEVALHLKNALNQGNIVTIKKELVDNPVSKDIPLENFSIEKAQTLDQKKSAARAKVHQRVSMYTSLLTGFDLLEFWMIASKLQAYGYNIMNEEGKEEVYLSIINTNNEDLISDLERFLEVKDVFDNMMKKYRGLKQYFREINDCDTEAELEDVQKTRGWLIN